MEEKVIKLEAEFFTEEALLAARSYYRGCSSRAGSSRVSGSWRGAKGSSKEKEVKRTLNPTGHDGEQLLCRACGSYRHMMEDNIILFTGNNKEKICSLGSETPGRLLLDSGCMSNVCGD